VAFALSRRYSSGEPPTSHRGFRRRRSFSKIEEELSQLNTRLLKPQFSGALIIIEARFAFA
jgi:hypothetical protein